MTERDTHHVLVTGLPGTGKTTLCNLFRDREINAIDADGPQISFSKNPVLSFLLQNTNLSKWHTERLKEVLRSDDEFYVFGISLNTVLTTKLFDEVIYLRADRKLLAQRLMDREDDTLGKKWWHKLPLAMASVLVDPAVSFIASKSKNKLRILDASASPDALFSLIYNKDWQAKPR